MVNRVSNGSIGIYHMLRDVLIASIEKGQFLVAIGSLIFIMVIIKMPGADVSKLVFELLVGARARFFLGWILWVVTMAGWYLHSRSLRRHWVEELVVRISE